MAFVAGLRMELERSNGVSRCAVDESFSRRSFLSLAIGGLGAVAMSVGTGESARADGWEYAAGGYGGLDDRGAEAVEGEESIDYMKFLDAIAAKKVERVDFYGPMGDIAYAIVGGKKIRIGQGFPVERSRGYSSPLWVARILDNNSIPYKFHYLEGAKYETMKSIGYANGCKGMVFGCMKGD
ncbi:hypothetical protein NDN08_004691 [Rhodosorus marinus]|uniref:Uncharacterized protein n=1 Tax=Rhodosorus marinus TaxID=101924 RepID=A0AAV8UQK1_9RHOD|nr:hypothetical protein NDN08_004691 [Rhodosorus marinus]